MAWRRLRYLTMDAGLNRRMYHTRHYTSKINCAEDLLSLTSYGFRGEAVASLCAVSNVVVTTKTLEDDVSTVYTFDKEGNITDKKPSHVGLGTAICARNLFSNLPVRKQCYNSSLRRKDDLKKIEGLLMAFAIVKPQLRINLRNGQDLLWQKPSMKDCKSVLNLIFGRQEVNNMLYLEKHMDEPQMAVSAYLPKPGSDVKALSRTTADRSFLVINDRPVVVKELSKVVARYYNNCHGCETLRHPLCYISINVPPEVVDVNIDPNKTTVYLQHMKEVQICLEEMLLEVYGPLENVPSWHYSDTTGPGKIKSSKDVSGNAISHYAHKRSTLENRSENEKSRELLDSETKKDREIPHHKEDNVGQKDTSDVNKTTGANNMMKEEALPGPGMAEHPLLSSKIVVTPHRDRTQVDLEAGGETHSSRIGVTESRSVPCQDNAVDETNAGRSGDTPIEKKPPCQENNFSINIPGRSWSLGQGLSEVSGKPIQPVQLLTPTARHMPGKRPLSPTAEISDNTAKKKLNTHPLTLSPTQSTLDNIVSSKKTGASAGSAFQHFCHERGQEMRETFPHEMEEDITERLQMAWDMLSNEEKVKYREKHWQDTKRYEKELKIAQSISSHKRVKVSVRDQVAHLASQSQAEKKKKKTALRNRLYCQEREVKCSLQDIQAAGEMTRPRSDLSDLTVVSRLESCDAWMCVCSNQLSFVNVHRLSEVVIYRMLMEKHTLVPQCCDPSIPLSRGNISNQMWPVLEEMAINSCTRDCYFHITDVRLVANGFDIRCHIDSDGVLQAELVGLCKLIPTYNLTDLLQVLQTISSNANCSLTQCRPTKVKYYLQGEAARMVLQSGSKKSTADVQDLLDNFRNQVDTLKTIECLHGKPVFHPLYDLSALL